MTVDTIEKPPKTSVPGQYLGFDLQKVRFGLHLLTAAKGDRVSLEYLDDVAVHHASSAFTLEQSKSSISGKGLTDKAVDLWKTFGNWADICQQEQLDPAEGRFVLYVTPEAPSPFVYSLAEATTYDAAKALLNQVKKWVKPTHADKGFTPHLSRFLLLGDERCIQVIRNFSLVVERDPLEGIRKVLRATLPDEVVEDFCKAVIGRAGEAAARLIRDSKPAIVDANAFRKSFQAFVRKHNLAGLLTPTTGVPDPAEIQRTIQSAPTYVRQLDAISLNPDLIVGAVGACLRTTADKINWAAEGRIVEESLTEFDTDLEKRFALVRDEVEDLSGAKDEEQRGRIVYRQCAAVQLPLEGRTLPNHFVEGAYNILADSLRVGWHPSYAALMERE